MKFHPKIHYHLTITIIGVFLKFHNFKLKFAICAFTILAVCFRWACMQYNWIGVVFVYSSVV